MGCMPSYQLPPPPCRGLGKASPKRPKMLCMVAVPPFVSLHICMYHICIEYVSERVRLRIDMTVSLVSSTISFVSHLYQACICIGPGLQFQSISRTYRANIIHILFMYHARIVHGWYVSCIITYRVCIRLLVRVYLHVSLRITHVSTAPHLEINASSSFLNDEWLLST